MSSVVEICNVALSTYLGARPISALDQDTPESDECALHFDRVRRSLLERIDWRFARRRELLVRIDDNDRPAWGTRYARPADLLTVRSIGSAYSGSIIPTSMFELSGDSIYSHAAGAMVDYTADLSDPAMFPPAFNDALAAALAASIARPITADGPTMQAAQEAAATLLDRAIEIDVNQRATPTVRTVPATLAVRGGGNSVPPVYDPSAAVAGNPGGTGETDVPWDFVGIYRGAGL